MKSRYIFALGSVLLIGGATLADLTNLAAISGCLIAMGIMAMVAGFAVVGATEKF